MPVEVKRLKVLKPSMKFFDFEGFEALVTAAGEIDPSKRLFVLLGGEAGMRAGEIRALEWKSIDLRRRVLTVEQSEWKGHVTLPKHDKIRHVPMTARLTQALRDFRHLRGPRVFYLDDEGPLVQRTLRRWLEKVCDQAGVEVHSPHSLRHVLLSPGHARRADARDTGVGGALGAEDDAAVHAADAGGAGARSACSNSRRH